MVKSKPAKRNKVAKTRDAAKGRASRAKARTRSASPSSKRAAKTKTAGKKKPSAPKKKAAAPKKAATETKKAANKKATTKKASANNKAATNKTTATGKTTTKKKAVVKKKAAVKKESSGSKGAARTVAGSEESARTPKPRRRARRITRMTLQEVLISLTTLAKQWEQFEWLDGIVLYGPRLRDSKAHREFSFMIVHRGLRTAAQARAARAQLDALLKTAVPVKRRLHLVNEPGLVEKIQQEDPAVEALLGQPIPIWVRSG